MAAEGKGPARFAIEVLEDGVDAASFRAAIGASGGGGGDVTGPASAVDDRIVTFDGTTGKLIQDSGTLISGLAAASHTHSSTAITDFTEAAQDAVGAMVDSSLVYTDGTPLFQRAALTGAITASAGSNTTAYAGTLDTVPAPVAAVNFNGQQATTFLIENRTSDPGSPSTGQLWLRTDL